MVLGLVLIVNAVAAGVLAEPIEFHVATNGRDTNPGTLQAPFATMVRARDAVRELKAAGPLTGPVTVYIGGGTYFLNETLSFDSRDTGTASCPITYRAVLGQEPELCGGRRIDGFLPGRQGIQRVALPDARDGKWIFRQLFVDGKRRTRARFPNRDPDDPARKGFLYAASGLGGFGVTVGCIHNVGDFMEYAVQVPADGEYRFLMYYAALNEPHGRKDMDGRTVLVVDDKQTIPLANLPDSGGWGTYRWADCARIRLTKGSHRLRWENVKGGGLDVDGYVLTDDPKWTAAATELPPAAPGKQMIVIQAENFSRSQGKQLRIVNRGGSKTAFHFRPGEFKPSWVKDDAELHIFQSASCRAFKEIVSIQNVDPGTSTVTVGGPECVVPLSSGDRYFVENLLEELDAPGEWFLDAQSGTLHFWPAADFRDDSQVIAPVLGRVIEVRGESTDGQAVHHLRFEGLTIHGTDYSPDDGCVGYKMGEEGVVFFEDAEDCEVRNCTFRNIGRYAVCTTGGGRHVISRNRVADSAQGGILVLDSGGNVISDNHIHHCGEVYKHIGGVVLQGSRAGENVVSHNLIHHISRYGITLKNAGLRNVIEYNHVHDTNLETYDTGAIEVTQHDRELRSGGVIRNNLVVDSVGYYSDGIKDVYMSWGIYLDSFAGGYEVTHNVSVRNSHGGIMLQGGKDNVIVNNIFVDSSMRQMTISNYSNNSTGLVLERNIVYYSDPEAYLLRGGQLGPEVIRVDRNLYYCPSLEVPAVASRGIASFEQWREAGFDTKSAWADPRFVDIRKGDYRLQADSPALGLGFEPIDMSTVGVRPEAR